jgi:hypothetical protein
VRPRAFPPRAKLVREAAALLAPVGLLACIKLAEHRAGMTTGWGGAGDGSGLLRTFTRFELLDPTFLVYTFDILGLGFTWVLGLPLVAAVLIVALRALAARERPAPAGLDGRNLRIVLTVLGLSFLLLTRYSTFNNVRYFAALYPLVVLGAGWALCTLELRAEIRRMVLALALALGFSFNFRSHDPLSTALFGSFPFGEHTMLRMGAPDPCCGHGRDQLAYNFEITQLHYLQDEVYRALRPTPETVLVAADMADFNLSGRIDAQTFERTLRFEGSYAIRVHDVSRVIGMKPLPEQVHFIVFPNFDNTRAYTLLAARYRQVGERTYERGGYALRVHTLERVEGAP